MGTMLSKLEECNETSTVYCPDCFKERNPGVVSYRIVGAEYATCCGCGCRTSTSPYKIVGGDNGDK